MTPQPKREFIKVDFPLEMNGEEELTCVLCQKTACEYAMVLRGGGRKVYLGIHEACAAPYGVSGASK